MKASVHPIDLEQRVADFAARVIGVCEKLPDRMGSGIFKTSSFVPQPQLRPITLKFAFQNRGEISPTRWELP